MHYPAKYNF